MHTRQTIICQALRLNFFAQGFCTTLAAKMISVKSAAKNPVLSNSALDHALIIDLQELRR